MINREQMSRRYDSCRNRFLDAVRHAGGELDHKRHPQLGPSGEPLFLDVGLLGNKQAKKLILIASGTHGIEGYLGSELQTRLLASSIFEAFLSDTLIIFIHGVNPFGMAWHRRVNENNVDINRNFLNFDKPPFYNSDYDLLSAAVNPEQFEADDIKAAEQKMAAFMEQHGLMQYIKALSGGQYHNAQGVQYGGQQAEWSNVTLNALWDQFIPDRELVLHIDLHSGLGNRGEGVLMLNGDEQKQKIKRIKACWDGLLISPRPTEEDFIMLGVLGTYLEDKFPSIDVIATVLEFGTVDMSQVASAMIADNWLHHHGDIDDNQGQEIKQQLFDAFYIDDDSYREQVYTRVEEVVTGALGLYL